MAKIKATTITISLSAYHIKKLDVLRGKLDIGRSAVLQRLIEQQSIFTFCEDVAEKK